MPEGSHPEGAGQDAEVGPAELHEVQQEHVRVLHLGQNNPHYQYTIEDEVIESNHVEKTLGVLMDKKLDMNRQCVGC